MDVAATPADAGTGPASGWRQVDEGWGRSAVDFASSASRATAASTSHFSTDVACGSGLAIELARAKDTVCRD